MESHRLVLSHFMFIMCHTFYIIGRRKIYFSKQFFVVLVVKPLSALVCIEPRRIYSSRISNDDDDST